MKFLTSLLFVLLSPVAFAGPGDGPIVPWPTSVVEDIFVDDIKGPWAAYDHNSVWFIDIDLDVENENSALITVRSAALFGHFATGSIRGLNHFFCGEITMDETHRAGVIIFRDHDGYKLRISDRTHRYRDMQLFRIKHGTRRD